MLNINILLLKKYTTHFFFFSISLTLITLKKETKRDANELDLLLNTTIKDSSRPSTAASSIGSIPLISPLRLAPPQPLPAPLQDVMAEHGNKVMAELKRINGGRLPVQSKDLDNILMNLRQRQGVPLHSSDMPALKSFLSLNNGRKQPYHRVIGRLRQAQRDSARRQRWKDDEKFRSRIVQRQQGFSRPGSPRLGYGAAGNTNLMESRQLFIGRRFDGK